MKLGEFSGGDTYFVSDLHLGHTNIIKYSSRPYASIEEMNAALLANWNEAVPDGANVFVLGDFAFANPAQVEQFLGSLPGIKHLVVGNHDKIIMKQERLRGCFATVSDIAEVIVGGHHVILCHYPMESWHGSNRGSLHLHGHSHGNSRLRKNRLDVGVDANLLGYRPISWGEVLELIEERNQRATDNIRTTSDNEAT